jgi:hypothetical protein
MVVALWFFVLGKPGGEDQTRLTVTALPMEQPPAAVNTTNRVKAAPEPPVAEKEPGESEAAAVSGGEPEIDSAQDKAEAARKPPSPAAVKRDRPRVSSKRDDWLDEITSPRPTKSKTEPPPKPAPKPDPKPAKPPPALSKPPAKMSLEDALASIDDALTKPAAGKAGASKPSESASTPTAKAVETGFVNIATPGGWATVFYKNKQIGTTPGRFEVPAGRARFRLKPFGGDKVVTVSVRVKAGELVKVTKKLSR